MTNHSHASPKLTLDAIYTWERTLPGWLMQLIDEPGKCVHRVERLDRTEAEALARDWAAKQGAVIAFLSGCFCFTGPVEDVERRLAELQRT